MDKREAFKKLTGRIVPTFCALLAWQLAAYYGLIDRNHFPLPTEIIAHTFRLLLKDTALVTQMSFSLKRLLIGSLIAVPAGIITGFFMGLSRKVERGLMPLVAATYPVPKIAILPFLLMIFGLGEPAQVTLIAIGVFYLVLFGVLHGIKSMPEAYFDICRVYKISGREKLFSVIFRGIVPDILNGCKIGISFGLVMVVGGELMGARNGIGFFMWNAWDQFDVLDLYAALILLSLTGGFIFLSFDLLSRRLKWAGRVDADRPAR